MASLKFHELAYPDGHPYGRSMSGYLETLPAITRDDLSSFQQGFGPRGAILVVVGAVKAEEAVRMVEAAFGDWQNPGQLEIPAPPPAPLLDGIRRTFVPIPGKTQSDIVLGNPGPPRNAPDFIPARVANSILGVFGLMGRLGDNVREDQGLAYYSYSQLVGGFGPGPWMISAGVDPANVNRAIESIGAEIRRMVDDLVTPEELADNKTFFKGQLVLGLETNEGVASTILSMEMYQLGLDYLRNYAAMIDAISAENVREAACHYLNPDTYALAVAGPGSGQPA
jgi:zinc protease